MKINRSNRSYVSNPSDVMFPIDDIVGTLTHGLSAVCLLLALVTWVTLRLTDRLVTSRYLILMATIVVSFLFHTVVFSSRLRAISVAMTTHFQQVTNHQASSNAATISPLPFAFVTSGVGRIRLTRTELFVRPLVSDVETATSFLHSSTPLKDSFQQETSAPQLRTKNTELNEIDDVYRSVNEGKITSLPAGNGVLSKILYGKLTETDFNSYLHPQISVVSDEDKFKSIRERDTGYIRTTPKASSFDDHKSVERKTPRKPNVKRGKKRGPKASSSDESWVTLCQAGKAFFLLSDLALYSFLFTVSLYYTLVVLGRQLTFNRLIAMFSFGLGLPVVFVTINIVLYTVLATETGFGAHCTVEAVVDEIHWTTTAPKLLCIVLALCLMTVSTYGFWHLHVPARSASSETFYAQQGVLKTLTLLLLLSVAELFFLVTEYQKLHGQSAAGFVVYLSTAYYGAKGLMLAILFCFLDSEILHCTCCPPDMHDDRPWLSPPPHYQRSAAGSDRGDGSCESVKGVGEENLVPLDQQDAQQLSRWEAAVREQYDLQLHMPPVGGLRRWEEPDSSRLLTQPDEAPIYRRINKTEQDIMTRGLDSGYRPQQLDIDMSALDHSDSYPPVHKGSLPPRAGDPLYIPKTYDFGDRPLIPRGAGGVSLAQPARMAQWSQTPKDVDDHQNLQNLRMGDRPPTPRLGERPPTPKGAPDGSQMPTLPRVGGLSRWQHDRLREDNSTLLDSSSSSSTGEPPNKVKKHGESKGDKSEQAPDGQDETEGRGGSAKEELQHAADDLAVGQSISEDVEMGNTNIEEKLKGAKGKRCITSVSSTSPVSMETENNPSLQQPSVGRCEDRHGLAETGSESRQADDSQGVMEVIQAYNMSSGASQHSGQRQDISKPQFYTSSDWFI